MTATSPIIGTLAERSLHAALKKHYARPGDTLETRVEGFVIDIVRGEHLIEIQTRHLYAMKRKLEKLLGLGYPITLVHPIPGKKWIVRQRIDGTQVSRRKSPKRGRVTDIFRELVRVPQLVADPGLTLDVVLTLEDEIWVDDGEGSWRRKGWSRRDRVLLDVASVHTFNSLEDFVPLLPKSLPDLFTTRDLREGLKCDKYLASKAAYALHKMGLIERVGKKGRSYLYELKEQV